MKINFDILNRECSSSSILVKSLTIYASWFSSECNRRRRQCGLPDHVDSVSQKTAQTVQTAPETHHGVSVKSQRRSRSEVKVHSRTTENCFCADFISILL